MKIDITALHTKMTEYYASEQWKMYDRMILLCAMNGVIMDYQMRARSPRTYGQFPQEGRTVYAQVRTYVAFNGELEWSFLDK